MVQAAAQEIGWLRKFCRFIGVGIVNVLDALFSPLLPYLQWVRGLDIHIRSWVISFLATYPPTSWVANSEWWKRVGPAHYPATWRTVREIIFRKSYLGVYSGCTRLVIAWQANDLASISDFAYWQPIIWGSVALFEFLFVLTGDAESGFRTRLWLPHTRAERFEAIRAALLTLGTTPFNTVIGLYVLEYHQRTGWAEAMLITLIVVIFIDIINIIRTKWEEDDDIYVKGLKLTAAEDAIDRKLRLDIADLLLLVRRIIRCERDKYISRQVAAMRLAEAQRISDQIEAQNRYVTEDIGREQKDKLCKMRYLDRAIRNLPEVEVVRFVQVNLDISEHLARHLIQEYRRLYIPPPPEE